MFVSTLYLCNASIAVIEHNNVLAEHSCHVFSDGSSNVIFICVASPELLINFLEKEFADPKKMFEAVCRQFQFELFRLMYGLNRE